MHSNNLEQVNQLVERCVRNKDRNAFDELVRLHQSQLRYSLRQLTGWDESLADDIAQDTFIRAYRSMGSFRFGAKFSTWLYRIAYNEFVDQTRKRKKSPLSDWEPDASLSERLCERSDTYQDLHADLAQAMLFLTEQQRAALHLSLHREYTQSEIADIMDCPLGTVKSHILRGKEKLQEVLADWREEVAK